MGIMGTGAMKLKNWIGLEHEEVTKNLQKNAYRTTHFTWIGDYRHSGIRTFDLRIQIMVTGTYFWIGSKKTIRRQSCSDYRWVIIKWL